MKKRSSQKNMVMRRRQHEEEEDDDEMSTSISNYKLDPSTCVTRIVRYAECQKNHAATLGGYAVDGCREFMARGRQGTAAALLCAACGCHRSFHRMDEQLEVVSESF